MRENLVEVETVESPVTCRTNVELKTEITIESDTEEVLMSIVSLSVDTGSNHLTIEESVTSCNTMDFIGALSPSSKVS